MTRFIALVFFTALTGSIAYNARPTAAPELAMPVFTEADATETKIRVHPVKTYYDRVPQEDVVLVMNNGGCIMTGRIRSRVDGACYREARLPERQQ